MGEDMSAYSPVLGGAKWDSFDALGAGRSLKWQHLPRLRSYANERICGETTDIKNDGLNRLLRHKLDGRMLERGISVGCGKGNKEMALLMEGLVGRFDLYEASAGRIAQGRALARQHGLEDRVRFHFVDAPGYPEPAGYDLVYWNAALHHMQTARSALDWSREALRPGGWFAMEEYVGPDRFQWSDHALQSANDFRSSLPERFFEEAAKVPRVLKRPSVERVIRSDPTESVDSAGIVEAVRATFPDADLRPMGGAFYHLAFRGIVAPFLEPQNAHLVEIGLVIDRLLETMGHYHFCAAVAQKA